MAEKILIIGKSGSGKSFSMKNLDPAKVGIITTINKQFPFKSDLTTHFAAADMHQALHTKVIELMQRAYSAGRKIIIVDDFQNIMVDEFMTRAMEKGYDKFSEIAFNAWSVIKAASLLPQDARVYFLSHSVNDDITGQEKLKTVGKMVDEKADLAGFFESVIIAKHNENNYYFQCLSDGVGIDCIKTPEGMFPEKMMPNDINLLDNYICKYRNITQ